MITIIDTSQVNRLSTNRALGLNYLLATNILNKTKKIKL